MCEEEHSITDSADRLNNIIEIMKYAAKEIRISNDESLGYSAGYDKIPLWRSFDLIIERTNFNNYSELRDNIILLCNRIIKDINSLKMKKETTRSQWIDAIETVKSVFDARYGGIPTKQVFDICFSKVIIEKIEVISERLQSDKVNEATEDQLIEALNAAKDAMNAYEKNVEIPEEISRILKHYLVQIEMGYRMYNDFGEEMFWQSYKELFSTFYKIHKIVLPDEQSREVSDAMRKMGDKMKYSLPGLPIIESALSIAASGTSVLTSLLKK